MMRLSIEPLLPRTSENDPNISQDSYAFMAKVGNESNTYKKLLYLDVVTEDVSVHCRTPSLGRKM